MKWLNETSKVRKVWIKSGMVLSLFTKFAIFYSELLLDVVFAKHSAQFGSHQSRVIYQQASEHARYASGVITKTWHCGDYKFESLKRTIWNAKYRNKKHDVRLCGDLLTDEVIAIFSEKISFVPIQWILTYIPSTTYNSGEKRFDHMQEIIKCMEPQIQNFISSTEIRPVISIAPNNTTTENKVLQRHARIDYSKRKFTVRANLSGKSIILMDDIVTTGASMAGAIKALQSAGAIHIYSIAVAH